ncbi:MAG: hypothetical protein ACYC3I_02090 [Gemmataceae bacterium]
MTSRNAWARLCWLSLLAPLLVALMVGCSQVRLLRDAPDGGVVSIPNNSNQWPTYYRNRAENLMHKKCPEGYTIVGEKVAVGNPAAHDGRKPNEDFDYEGAYVRLTTYDRKEYHIIFRRGAAAIPAAPSASPRSAAKGESKDELPPPRPLPSEP